MRNMIFLRPWTNDHKEIRALSGREGYGRNVSEPQVKAINSAL